MKGQRLFVRPTTPADSVELGEFYSNEESPRPAIDQPGLVGKVVGEIVAHVSFTQDSAAIRITSIYVARLLRRKRVGRFMVSEIERLAAGGGIDRIEADSRCEMADFFRAIGFRESPGSETLVRPVDN